MKKGFLKKDWARILTGILLLLGLVISFTNINATEPGFKNNWWEYSLIGLILVILYIIVYYYVKNLPNNEEHERELSFFKTLLPTSLAILSLIYALSSGFFSLQKQSLELDTKRLVEEKSELKKQKFRDSVSLANLRESLENKFEEYEIQLDLNRIADSISDASYEENEILLARTLRNYDNLKEREKKLSESLNFLGPYKLLSDYFSGNNTLDGIEMNVLFGSQNVNLTDKEVSIVVYKAHTKPGENIQSFEYNERKKRFVLDLNPEKFGIGTDVVFRVNFDEDFYTRNNIDLGKKGKSLDFYLIYNISYHQLKVLSGIN